MAKKVPMSEYAEDLCHHNLLFNREDSPLKAHLSLGANTSPVLVVAGANASGKSFAIRVLSTWMHSGKPKVEALVVSMKMRTQEGMHRAIMYGPFGDESDSSGAVSMHAVQGGLSTLAERTTPCCLLLDEPDLGLSEDYAPALGELLARKVNAGLGKHAVGLVVVTHSRALVTGLAQTLEKPPHFIHVGDQPLTLDEWLESGYRRSVEELEELGRKSVETYRALQAVLDKLEGKRS